MTMTVYARRYCGQETDLVEHSDGRVGVYSPHRQQWIEIYGLGTTHAGFIRAMLDGSFPVVTADGRAWVDARRARAGA